MTNIVAVRIKHDKKPYVFCAADSQSTSLYGGHKSENVQKIVRRGSNILMMSGRTDIKDEVYDKLQKIDLPPSQMAVKVLEITQDFAKSAEKKPENQSCFFVAGEENKDIAMYEVLILDIKKLGMKRTIVPVRSTIYDRGSGERYVAPAINRDMEKGNFLMPNNPLEAMLLCNDIQIKANEDIGVNNRTQFGFVTPGSARILLHPTTRSQSYEDTKTTIKLLAGIEWDFGKKDKRNKYRAPGAMVNAFYHALEVELSRVHNIDLDLNWHNTQNKSDKRNMRKYKDLLKEYDEEKARLQPIVTAFVEGGLAKLIEATRGFDKYQASLYSEAEKFIEKKPAN